MKMEQIVTVIEIVQVIQTNGKQDTTGNQKSLQKTYIMENLEKLYTMRERIFNDFDKKCFLHIW